MYVCMYVCMYVRMYVCTYVRMYVCTYIIFGHVCIHDLSPSQPFSHEKHLSPFQKKTLSRDYSLRTQSPTERKPLSWTFCSTLKYICMHPGKLTWNLHFTHLAKENHLPNLQCVSEYHLISAKYENSRPTKT